MYLFSIIVPLVISLCGSSANAAPTASNVTSAEALACSQLASTTLGSSLAQPGSTQFAYDIAHWSNASSLNATCSVEPASVEDIQQLFSLINSTRTLWAVKGGGHSNIQFASSTTGLQIDMTRFRNVSISADKSNVTLGMGMAWGDVYGALQPHNLTVVGGRLTEVGMAGLVLGAGFSWLTNAHGFAVDNTLAYEIVLPNGTFTTVTAESNPDLFFALQGGQNNFGIVTQITLNAFPTTEIWGGQVVVQGDLTQFNEAVANWTSVQQDTHATLATTFDVQNGTLIGIALIYYNGSTAPSGLFDPFLNLPNSTVNVTTQTYLQFMESLGSGLQPSGSGQNRASWYSAPVLKWSNELITYIMTELQHYYTLVTAKSGTQVTSNIDPFGPAAYTHARDSAWPHGSAFPYNTFGGLFAWDDPEDDEVILGYLIEYHQKVWQKAIELNVSSTDNVYFPPTYSQYITTAKDCFGPNLPRLRKIQEEVDPWGLVALTGGFKVSS